MVDIKPLCLIDSGVLVKHECYMAESENLKNHLIFATGCENRDFGLFLNIHIEYM